MVSRTRGNEVFERKPDASNDTTESGKREQALKTLLEKTEKLQAILDAEQKNGKISEDDQRKKLKLREIIERQLDIYERKKGNNPDVFKLCKKLLDRCQ